MSAAQSAVPNRSYQHTQNPSFNDMAQSPIARLNQYMPQAQPQQYPNQQPVPQNPQQPPAPGQPQASPFQQPSYPQGQYIQQQQQFQQRTHHNLTHTTTQSHHTHKYRVPDQQHQHQHHHHHHHHQQVTVSRTDHLHKYAVPPAPPSVSAQPPYAPPPPQQQAPQIILNSPPQAQREIQPVKQIVNNKQPEVNEIYHVERELQVLSVEDVEEPWKKKCIQLEIIIYDLQTELARYKQLALGEKVQSVDETQIKELEAKINYMKEVENQLRNEIKSQASEIDQWRNRYQKLQLEYQQKLAGGDEMRILREQLSEKERVILKLEGTINRNNEEIQTLMKQLQSKDQDINYLRNELRQMEDRMESYVQTEEQISYLSNEVDVWKNKFKNANKEFHDAQEKWMMAQAELDSLKNKQTVVTTEKQTVVNTTNVRNSRMGTSNYKQGQY